MVNETTCDICGDFDCDCYEDIIIDVDIDDSGFVFTERNVTDRIISVLTSSK
jgi:hypothetical protein